MTLTDTQIQALRALAQVALECDPDHEYASELQAFLDQTK